MVSTGDPLGVDIACTTGFPLVTRLCWGEENLGNAAIRRLNSDEGCLESIGDDPNYGFNVIDYLNRDFDPNQPGALAALGARVRAELEKDERFQTVNVRVLAGADGLSILIEGETARGPFSLVLGVGDLTVDRLNQGIPAPSPTGDL